jgi:hypothetical protein
MFESERPTTDSFEAVHHFERAYRLVRDVSKLGSHTFVATFSPR